MKKWLIILIFILAWLLFLWKIEDPLFLLIQTPSEIIYPEDTDGDFVLEDVEKLLFIIAQAESSGGKFLVGDQGRSLGKYQICALIVREYNRVHNTQYRHIDLLNPEVDDMVARWQIQKIISILKEQGHYSLAKVIHFWNRGPRALKEATPRYHKNLVYCGIYQKEK